MDLQWLYKKNRDFCLLFCNGWGMDKHPFLPLKSHQFDVLICSDYTNETGSFEVEKLLKNYSRLVLVGWSMGVAFAQKYFLENRNLFQQRIAINGTLCPINDDFGIPMDVFEATLKNMSEKTMLNFYRRMCRSREILGRFLENKPARTVDSQQIELQAIFNNFKCIEKDTFFYTDVIVSRKDMIIPTGNQLRFWGRKNVSLVSGYHFPFYRWKSWDELVESTKDKE